MQIYVAVDLFVKVSAIKVDSSQLCVPFIAVEVDGLLFFKPPTSCLKRMQRHWFRSARPVRHREYFRIRKYTESDLVRGNVSVSLSGIT